MALPSPHHFGSSRRFLGFRLLGFKVHMFGSRGRCIGRGIAPPQDGLALGFGSLKLPATRVCRSKTAIMGLLS